MKLLFAEDEIAMSEAVTDILTYHHYIVDAVYDGVSALEYARAEKYDGIILDVMMPMLDGYQVLSTIRKFETERNFKPEERTKVVMTTALNEEINVKKAMEIGCDAYVGKPINVERFTMLLSKMGFEKIKD